MAVLLYLFSMLVSAVLLVLALPLGKQKNLQDNYRKKKVPGGMGLLIVLTFFFVAPLAAGLGIVGPYLLGQKLFLLSGVALAGQYDDFYGDLSRGFKGHIHTLIREKKLSTGLTKAVTGGLLGLTLALSRGGGFYLVLLNSLLVPLSVNFFNLLDARPGRALKVFMVFALAAVWGAREPVLFLLMPVLGAAVVLLPLDLKEKIMLGDVGSNVLGASVGFTLVYALEPSPLKLYTLFCLGLAQWVGDRVSFSQLIQQNLVLRYFDRLGRIF